MEIKMNKEAYYFSHDSNARNDEKLLAVRMRHKSSGYGVYFMILERFRDSNNYMSIKDYNVIAFDLREDAGLIKSVVEDFGLFVFTEDGKYFYSDSFNKRMVKKDEIKTQLSIKGIKGNLVKHKHLTREEIEKMTDDEILFFNEKIKKEKDFVAHRSPSDEISSQRKEIKRKENKLIINENFSEEYSEAEFEFIEIWKKARFHFDKQKCGFTNLISFEKQNFKNLLKIFSKKEFEYAVAGLFFQSTVPAVRVRPTWLLEQLNFEKMLDCWINKNKLFEKPISNIENNKDKFQKGDI